MEIPLPSITILLEMRTLTKEEHSQILCLEKVWKKLEKVCSVHSLHPRNLPGQRPKAPRSGVTLQVQASLGPLGRVDVGRRGGQRPRSPGARQSQGARRRDSCRFFVQSASERRRLHSLRQKQFKGKPNKHLREI